MIYALVSDVMWPPSYYVMRDRIPFFLTLIWVHRSIFDYDLNILGLGALCLSAIATGVSTALYFTQDSMGDIFGINWSAPSPIEWGAFVIIASLMLYSHGLEMFDAYYLAFITAMAGGWLYEFIPTLFHGFYYFYFFKINAVKVFFMEFQVLCLPLLLWVVSEHYVYRINKLLPVTIAVFLLFCNFNQGIMAYFRATLNYSYRWWVRLPAITMLLTYLKGVYPR